MKPRIFVPTLYFMQGLPYTIVIYMSVVFLNNLGASNEINAFVTSWFQTPWVIKALWAPAIDFFGTRKSWIVVSQAVLAVLSGGLALTALMPSPLTPVLILLGLMAFASATQDVAMDGYYLDILTREEQAFFVGVRGTAFKLATLFGNGTLVYLAGTLAKHSLGVRGGWSVAFAATAAISTAACLFHLTFLPRKREQRSEVPSPTISTVESEAQSDSLHVETKEPQPSWQTVLASFFKQDKIVAIVVFILIFRLGDALAMKMAQLFLLDTADKGGLQMATDTVGLIYGTVGTLFLLVGGILGGWCVSRLGLKRCLLPAAIIQNSAILLYVGLAYYRPSPAVVACANAYEQFAYGLGVSAYTVFLLSTVKSQYKAAHYALATALMACGVMLPGMAAGYIEKSTGYTEFFLLSFLASLPGIITIPFLPINDKAAAQSETVKSREPVDQTQA